MGGGQLSHCHWLATGRAGCLTRWANGLIQQTCPMFCNCVNFPNVALSISTISYIKTCLLCPNGNQACFLYSVFLGHTLVVWQKVANCLQQIGIWILISSTQPLLLVQEALLDCTPGGHSCPPWLLAPFQAPT